MSPSLGPCLQVTVIRFPILKIRSVFACGILLLLCAAVDGLALGDIRGDVRRLIKDAAKLTRHGKLDEAEDSLRKAVALDERRTEAKVELALVLTKQRRLGEAYEIVFPIAKAEAKNARAYSVLGATLLAGGRFREARLVFYTAIRLDRKQDLAWAGYGMLDFYENQILPSLSNLREAVYYDPTEPDYLFALAQVSARAEKYTEAAQAYQDFLAVSNDTDADRRARIRGLINFLHYLGRSGTLYTVAGAERTAVPFELVGNRPIVKVHLNGNPEPLRFVLDTGSGISVISDKTAKRLKVKSITRGGFARGIGGNGKFEIVYGLLREIKIGDVALKQVPVYLRKFHDQSHEVDGYIGLALISKFLTTIDYGNNTFSLTRRGNDTREFRENSSEISLPLRLTSSGFLSGEVSLQGVDAPLNFIVDTGASVSVISHHVANTDLMTPRMRDERLTVTGSAGVTEDVKSYMLPQVSFGKHSRRDIMAISLDLDLINEASGFEQSGILGGNFLKNYRMTFDFKNSKVIFVPLKAENE
ncbi:MAG: aspartyl protease family protein [Pyrinomonadaceae bacterium]